MVEVNQVSRCVRESTRAYVYVLTERVVFASTDYLHPRSGVPAQPFMADTSMPPYPYYSIDSQTTVEEATRRLEAWKGTRDATQ